MDHFNKLIYKTLFHLAKVFNLCLIMFNFKLGEINKKDDKTLTTFIDTNIHLSGLKQKARH